VTEQLDYVLDYFDVVQPVEDASLHLVVVDGGEEPEQNVHDSRGVDVLEEERRKVVLGLDVVEELVGLAEDERADYFGKVAG